MSNTPTITNLTNINGQVTSAVTSINANFASIVAAFENTLALNGGQGVPMEAALDMNSFTILNLPTPQNPTDPIRLQDLENTYLIGNPFISTTSYTAYARLGPDGLGLMPFGGFTGNNVNITTTYTNSSTAQVANFFGYNFLSSTANGPAYANVTCFISSEKESFLTSILPGELDLIYMTARQGDQGDLGGILLDLQKTRFSTPFSVNTSDEGGIVAWEAQVAVVNAGGFPALQMHSIQGFAEGAGGLSNATGFGGYNEAHVGIWYSANHVDTLNTNANANSPTFFTASISSTTMTVTGIGNFTQPIQVGMIVTGSNTQVSAGTVITAFVSGTQGGIGVYTVNNSQTVTSQALYATWYGWQYAFSATQNRVVGSQYFAISGDQNTLGYKPGDIIQGIVGGGNSKVLRTTSVGVFSILNDAATTSLFQITDAGLAIFASTVESNSSFIAAASTAIPAGGSYGYLLSSHANFGITFGSGLPTLSAAQGSIYLRSDGSSTSTRLYVNTNGTTGWTNLTSAT